jgi:hypothetical protein
MRICPVWPGSAQTLPRLSSRKASSRYSSPIRPPEHALHVGDDGVQVEDLGLEHLAAA